MTQLPGTPSIDVLKQTKENELLPEIINMLKKGMDPHNIKLTICRELKRGNFILQETAEWVDDIITQAQEVIDREQNEAEELREEDVVES